MPLRRRQNASPISHASGEDYAIVKQVIELITLEYREQPSLENIADELGQSPTQLQKVFTPGRGFRPRPSCRR